MGKTEPLRMCAVTREMLPKSELIRLVNTPHGIEIDNKKKLAGRGIYIKKSLEVIALAKKKKLLNKAFRCNVEDEVYTKLEECANGN
ncbi:MAG: YlxR family protein [Clostridia bacterium]|nr:YlxR family protein [Clostridia bacterium]